MRIPHIALLTLLLLSVGCGPDEPEPGLPTLDVVEFRAVLRAVRAEEFTSFSAETQRLVEGAQRELRQGMHLAASSIPGMQAAISAAPMPLALSDVPGPLPIRLSDRLQTLAIAAIPELLGPGATKMGEDLSTLARKAVAPYLTRAVESVPMPEEQLEKYAAPPGWFLDEKRPANLNVWLRRMQRRPLSKTTPWDVRIGDYLAGGAEHWQNGSDPITVCLGRMFREILKIPDMLRGLVVVMKHDALAGGDAQLRQMLSETIEAVTALMVERVRQTWHRLVFLIDEYLYWEFGPASGSKRPGGPSSGPPVPVISSVRGALKKDPKPDPKSAPDAVRGTSYALLFAVDDYDQLSKLRNPIKDATAMRDVLRDTYGFETELVTNPRHADLRRKLREYALRKFNNPKDQLLVFFAGHGCIDEVMDLGSIALKDAPALPDPQQPMQPGYERHDYLLSTIDRIPCDHILVIMDACFSGAAFTSQVSSSRSTDHSADIAIAKLVQRKQKYKTRKLITSGGKEYVADGGAGQHSPFAARVLETLRTLEAKQEGVITFGGLLDKVSPGWPGAFGGALQGNEPGSEFFFVKWRPSGK